jgi:hypothetical protein
LESIAFDKSFDTKDRKSAYQRECPIMNTLRYAGTPPGVSQVFFLPTNKHDFLYVVAPPVPEAVPKSILSHYQAVLMG